MSLSLVIADNGDGTGGKASIFGSDSGSTNTLFNAPFSGATGPLSWASVGSRTGDGQITISQSITAMAYYQWQLTATVSSSPAFASYFRALSNVNYKSVLSRTLTAVVQQLQTLNLTGISSANIVRRWQPRAVSAATDPLPMIQVVPINNITFPGMLTGADDIGYPVGLLYFDNQNKDYVANIDRNTLWLEVVSRIFRNQRLSGVNESLWCEPMQWDTISKEGFDANLFMAFQAFRFKAREGRGPLG